MKWTSEACRKRSVFNLSFYTEDFPGSILTEISELEANRERCTGKDIPCLNDI